MFPARQRAQTLSDNRFLKMHSNVGYIATLALNLSLLLPLMNNSKVNNYVLVL